MSANFQRSLGQTMIAGNLQTRPLEYRNHGLNQGGVGHSQWQLTTLQLSIVH